ncbi:MAG: helix-turn-helix domain-containing protein [Halobacteriales archaeon]|nr:helix-turn-helix domain-containing protein [Halobacteriales archaeon]
MIDEALGVEVRLEGDGCPLADASELSGATIDADPPQLRDDGYALLRFSAPADDGLAAALDADDRLRYLHVEAADGRMLFRCLSVHPCVVHELVSEGFLVESLRYRGGTAHVVGAVVGHEVLQGVMDAAGDTVGARLERVYPMGPDDGSTVERRWNLTPAQAEALRAAHAAGYFSVPRGATASEVAATLDISKSAFLERLRRGQSALLEQVM